MATATAYTAPADIKQTLNWCYGAKSPDIEKQVSDAIYAAHRYRNKLCELELAKRDRHEQLLRRLAPEYLRICGLVEATEKQLGEVRETIQRERVKQRTKQPKGVDHLKADATELKSRLKGLRADRKEAKTSAYEAPRVKASMDENAAIHKAAMKQAKSESGLYWGTEAIVKQACASFGSGAPPRFRRYEGEGQLAAQLQGGLDVENALRTNTLCYFENADGKHADCMIRVGSDGRDPIFARVPIVMHRTLPDGGRIKWAYLERRMIATHVRWTIRLTVDRTTNTQVNVPHGDVAVHTGWKMEPSGLRVATWLGSDGRSGVLRLPMDHCDDYYKLDEVRAGRDGEFNAIRDELRAWLKDRDVPDWLAEIRPHLHAWRSPSRLAAIVLRWHDDRFEGDEKMFPALDRWRKKDKHAWQHERRLSVRIARRRKTAPNDRSGFRSFAAMLAKHYGVVYVSPIDAKALTENSDPEDVERDNTQSHRHAKWAAVSELTRMVREKFPLRCVDVSPVNITRECNECGEVNVVKRRKVQCVACGHTHDVDENAVRNTLARGQAAVKSGALLELQKEQRDREQKQREKLAKMQDANRTARKRKQNDTNSRGEKK